MSYIILVQILDGDMYGKSGGTQYRLSISHQGVVIESHDYSIMDEIDGTFNPSRIIKKYNDENIAIQDAQSKLSDLATSTLKSKMLEAKKSKPMRAVCVDVIVGVVDNNQVLVDTVKNGVDKALNALVGKCIKELKKKSLMVDPLNIKIELERIISSR